MKLNIPEGSIITEEMVTWYMEKFGMNEDAAIGDISEIERGNGRIHEEAGDKFPALLEAYVAKKAEKGEDAGFIPKPFAPKV